MTRDHVTFADLERFAREAIAFAKRAGSFEAFEDDRLVQSAVLHHLMVIGEATKRLSPSFRDRHSDIPWTKMARMRDRLIHGYDNVDLGIVWGAVTEDIAGLLPQLRTLLESL